MVLVLFAYSGLETALIPSAEVKDPSRDVPRATLAAIALVVLLYLGIQIVCQGVLGPALADAKAPVASAAGALWSPGFGLLIAGGTGVGSWVFGYPFLTAHAQYVDLPLIGPVPAATAMIFDLGVFGVVVGSTILMLIAIAHQSLRLARARAQDEATQREQEAA